MPRKNKKDSACYVRERYQSDPELRRKQAERNARWKAKLTKEEFTKSNRSKRLRHKYKMTLAEYDALLSRQNNRCALCPTLHDEAPKHRLCVDHDHRCCPEDTCCGRCVRGLLCSACKALLGWLEILM